ncbi:MAG: nucleotide exchange factor GrpE [Desulfobacca sp.]|uniref:nucleotide exchange factor GrpE n=1 Tax=Desulfobacca sp. TaxID=2067990 RepID=UPI00404B6436
MGFSTPDNKEPSETATASTDVPEVELVASEECDHEALIRQLAEKEEEIKELREKHEQLLRMVADVENFRKRLEKERADLRDYANESLLKELLPVLDNLELALNHGRDQEACAALVAGVENVLKGFRQAIARFGVTPIEALGEKFDPAFHNAVMLQEDDSVADQTVIQELQKGYMLKNRLLRPAMVVVARKPESSKVECS